MLLSQSPYHIYQRYRTLRTHHISALPVVILMPHSACNCRCVMCDIWKDNKNLKQLTETDIWSLLDAFKKWGTKRVLMSGGEALLNPNFFRFCEILQNRNIKISLLSTGIALKNNARQICTHVEDLIVSLDGDEITHDAIRNLPGAFRKMKEGIEALRSVRPDYPVSGRSVIHRLNFRKWADIIKTAKELGLNRISFLPADTSSSAFNREQAWELPKQQEIALGIDELDEMKQLLENIIRENAPDLSSGFIAESPEKLKKIHSYYAAFYGLNPYPYKKCNAPWVSAVVEADGTVRPCFFHEAIGNIRKDPLDRILNSPDVIAFRRSLDMDKNPTCEKCVCYLNLSPTTAP
jgi:MoaA/NifB/PqqE/SkfB family radical SAM enzyme